MISADSDLAVPAEMRRHPGYHHLPSTPIGIRYARVIDAIRSGLWDIPLEADLDRERCEEER